MPASDNSVQGRVSDTQKSCGHCGATDIAAVFDASAKPGTPRRTLKEIVKFLDDYVLGQQEATETQPIAVYNLGHGECIVGARETRRREDVAMPNYKRLGLGGAFLVLVPARIVDKA